MAALKLALKQILGAKAHSATAALGIAAATAFLAWHLELAETVSAQADEIVESSTAPFSAWITGAAFSSRRNDDNIASSGDRATAEATVGFRRTSQTSASLPVELLLKLEKSAEVRAELLTVHHASLDVRPGGRVLQGPPLIGGIAAIPADGVPPLQKQRNLTAGRWPNPDFNGNEAVFNENLFIDRGLPPPEPGTRIPVMLRGGTVVLEVVGLFKSDMIVRAFPSVYTTRQAIAEIAALSPGSPTAPNLALCETLGSTKVGAVEKLLESVPQADSCILYTRDAVSERYRSDTSRDIMSQLPMSLPLAFITAACMLLTMLSTSMAGQRRTIALLRCNGMLSSSVVLMLVCQAFMLCAIGWVIGMLAATLLVQIFLLLEATSELPALVSIGWKAPVATAILTLFAGLVAVIAPCVQIARIRPLEIVGKDNVLPRPVSLVRTLLGIVLLLPMPLMALHTGISFSLRTVLLIAVAMPCFVAGCALCLHALMRSVELILSKPLSALLGLDSDLLSRRISRAPGRAAGTILALSFGLGAFMAIHIWGGSLTASYVPSPEWPDIIVSMLPNGIDREAFEAMAKAEGAAQGTIPIEASQFELSEATMNQIESNGLPRPKSDLLLIFGVDPEAAFGGDEPLADFKFVEGDRLSAAAAMSDSDSCIVPVMFTRLTGLHLGDSVELAGRRLEICGVVDLNWHLVTSRARVRNLFGPLDTAGTPKDAQQRKPTMGMAFTSEKFARSITKNSDSIYFAWMNLSDKMRALHPLNAAVRLDASLNAVLADSYKQRDVPRMGNANALQVHHRDEIADGTIAHGYDILGTMSRIPFWSVAVASLGIAAMLVTSAQASRHEIATMRAVGMTRGQLAAMFAGEAAFAVACAIILSLVAGIFIGWSFTSVTAARMADGLPRVLHIPWIRVVEGVFFMLLTTSIMAILPLRRIVADRDAS